MALLAPVIKQRFFDNNGNPLAGGKLYSYAAGTTNLRATYKNKAGTEYNTNPIILDSRGECDIWIQTGNFKFVLTDSSDSTIWTVDNVQSLADILSNDEGALAVMNNLSDLNSVDTALTNLSTGTNGAVITANATQTVTNKSIDATTNTLINIDNSSIKTAAAIAVNKLAATTASRVLTSDASGFISASGVTSTELGYVSGVTSAIQTQVDAKIAKSTIAAKGDIVIGTAANTPSAVAVGTNGQVLTADSTQATGVKWSNVGASTAPKITVYTSGSGTHTITGSPLFVVVELIGGGGGGGGSGSGSPGTGGAGGNSTFGSLTAGGASGGKAAGVTTAATGGTATGGDINIAGGDGVGGGNTGNVPGPTGASTFFGSGGSGGIPGGAGVAAKANTGAGGGGAGAPASASGTGGAGPSGGFVKKIITSPSSTYSYSVGSAGTAGAAGTSGFAGGAGGSGLIVVYEHYQ